jgi:SET domain-containing protein
VTADDQDYSSDNDDENVKELWRRKKQHVRTIKAFLIDYNCVQVPGHQLHHGCLFKWLKAHKRGEFEEWGGLNDLSKSNAKAQKIMGHIYHSIKERDPDTAYWNKIVRKSQISPDKYGVIAMRFVPRGTVLGFFKGDCVTSTTPVTMSGLYRYELDRFTFIDGSSFTSCFARYYACSGNVQKQNVSVHRLQIYSSPNRRVCFMSLRDIEKGEEFVIAHNQDFFRSKHKSAKEISCPQNNSMAQVKADMFGN